jgi:hypothetical protein
MCRLNFWQDDDGSSTYSNTQMPHDALRAMSKLYIQAFQAGQKAVTPTADQVCRFYDLELTYSQADLLLVQTVPEERRRCQ